VGAGGAQYVQNNKDADADWFRVESDATGLQYAPHPYPWGHASWRLTDVCVLGGRGPAGMCTSCCGTSFVSSLRYVPLYLCFRLPLSLSLRRLRVRGGGQIPATYPAAPPALRLPELDGKTAKMYRCADVTRTYHHRPRLAKCMLRLCPCISVDVCVTLRI
jgi:hypothetical protein